MTQKNQPKAIIDRGQLYDAYLQTPYLHDQTIEQIIYINQILFIEMSGDCVEFN